MKPPSAHRPSAIAPAPAVSAEKPPPRPGRLLGLVCAAMLFLTVPAPAAVETPPRCPDNISLCLRAADSGKVDLKTGTTEMEGNVLGYVRVQQLKFEADSLQVYRGKKNDWERLVLDRNVRLTQPDTVATADNSVLRPDRALLLGDAKVERSPYYIEGHEIELDEASRRVTAKGTPQMPATVVYNKEAAEESGQESQPAAARGDGKPETIFIQAQHAVVDSNRNEIVLTGQASIDRPELNWHLKAGTAHLKFNDQRKLQTFRAEGGVTIIQPERTLGSDTALSRNNNETILLIGNASVKQPGKFTVTSDRLEVYTDAEKGGVQGQDKDKPIKLAMDINPDKRKRNAYLLDDSRLQTLSGKGVPFETLNKLQPLKGRSFPNLDEFQAALRLALTAAESAQFMEAIISHAR